MFVGGIAAFFVLDGQRYFSLASIRQSRALLVAFADQHYVAALAVGFLTYVSVVSLSIPVSAVLGLTLGFLFGRWVGTALIVASATTGATIVFLAARYLFADFARKRLGHKAQANRGFTRNGFSYMLFLRLVPFPFFLVNLAPALSSIRVGTYALATLIGVIPASFIYANLGHAIGEIDSPSELVSYRILGALALLGVLALLPVAVDKVRANRR